VSRLYYLWGEEHLLQEEFIKKIEELLASSNCEKNIFYGTGLSIDDLASAMASMSLFSSERLVIIKEAHKIRAAAEKTIAGILANGFPAAYIIFINPQKLKKDVLSKNVLIKTIAETGLVVQFRPLYQQECVKYIVNEFRKNERAITEKDADYLYQIAGDNLYDLKNEIEKLVLYTIKKGRVTDEDIGLCSGFIKQESMIAVTNAITEGDREKTLRLVDNLLNSKEETFMVFSLIYRAYRKIMLARSMKQKNIPEFDISRRISVYDKGFFDKIKKFRKKDIIRKLEILHDAEFAIKSGKVENADLRPVVAELF